MDFLNREDDGSESAKKINSNNYACNATQRLKLTARLRWL